MQRAFTVGETWISATMFTAVAGPLRILAGSAHPELADPLAAELSIDWSKTAGERFTDGGIARCRQSRCARRGGLHCAADTSPGKRSPHRTGIDDRRAAGAAQIVAVVHASFGR